VRARGDELGVRIERMPATDSAAKRIWRMKRNSGPSIRPFVPSPIPSTFSKKSRDAISETGATLRVHPDVLAAKLRRIVVTRRVVMRIFAAGLRAAVSERRIPFEYQFGWQSVDCGSAGLDLDQGCTSSILPFALLVRFTAPIRMRTSLRFDQFTVNEITRVRCPNCVTA